MQWINVPLTAKAPDTLSSTAKYTLPFLTTTPAHVPKRLPHLFNRHGPTTTLPPWLADGSRWPAVSTTATAMAAPAAAANAWDTNATTSAPIHTHAHRERPTADANADAAERVDTAAECHVFARRPTAIPAAGTAR